MSDRIVPCPYCGNHAALVGGARIYPSRPDLARLRFWLCAPCDAYVGCHKAGEWIPGVGHSDGTLPLGRLADVRLRASKRRAHAAFDALWKSGRMKRRDAYRWLATRMGKQPEDCHIGMFGVDECSEVVDLCNSIAARAATEE
jgi:hypothetical protein